MAGKRILLMHISKISGHYVAAMAIEKALKSAEPACQVIPMDAFEYTNPRSERVVNAIYMFLIQRLPFLWEYLYDNPVWVKRTAGFKDAIHRRNIPKLDKLFSDCKPDAVVCTQAFPCGMVAAYKKYRNINTPLVGVLTDYVPHSYWIYDNVDYYVTPSEEVMERLVKKGVGRERIRPFGIPFDPKFSSTLDRDQLRAKFGLQPAFTVLVMGGGQGLGPIKTVVQALDKLDAALQVIVVCGTNKKIYDSLKKISPSFKKKILLLGYCNNIDELMAVSDVVVSKPGGVTVAEALCKGSAMVIVDPLPGQELNNADYLTAHNAALKVARPGDAGTVVKALYDAPEKLRSLSQAARAISKPNAAMDIAKLTLAL